MNGENELKQYAHNLASLMEDEISKLPEDEQEQVRKAASLILEILSPIKDCAPIAINMALSTYYLDSLE